MADEKKVGQSTRNGVVHKTVLKFTKRERTWSQMHENPVTEAKIIAGPPGTTLRNRETTVGKGGDMGIWKTWYGTRRAVRKMSHCSTQAPHEPSHAVTTSSRRLRKARTRLSIKDRGATSRGWSFAAVVGMWGSWCSLWTGDDAAVGAGVTYVHEVAANQRDWRGTSLHWFQETCFPSFAALLKASWRRTLLILITVSSTVLPFV